ncbi:MAG TPA: A24 family peptidase [Bryobacteraceae bacterium]|jgi:prepilin peptidase CpaA
MHSIAWWPIFIAVLIATISDIHSRRIPNWLVFPLLGTGIAISGIVRGWSGLGHSVAGVFLAVLLLGLPYMFRGMGMGDLKLCAAIGAWVWPHQLVLVLVVMGLVGGVMALVWAIFRGFLKEMLAGTSELVFGMKKRGLRPHPTLVLSNPKTRKMPYAPAIAIGAIVSFLAVA